MRVNVLCDILFYVCVCKMSTAWRRRHWKINCRKLGCRWCHHAIRYVNFQFCVQLLIFKCRLSPMLWNLLNHQALVQFQMLCWVDLLDTRYLFGGPKSCNHLSRLSDEWLMILLFCRISVSTRKCFRMEFCRWLKKVSLQTVCLLAVSFNDIV